MTNSDRAPHGKAGEDPDIIGSHHESSSDSEDDTDSAWKSYNLLSLGYKILFARFSDCANHRNAQMAVVSVATGPF